MDQKRTDLVYVTADSHSSFLSVFFLWKEKRKKKSLQNDSTMVQFLEEETTQHNRAIFLEAIYLFKTAF